jgi:hypothetical protein
MYFGKDNVKKPLPLFITSRLAKGFSNLFVGIPLNKIKQFEFKINNFFVFN